jgi:hypothetical protein
MRRRSNCFVWAFVVWIKLVRRGERAYLCWRISDHITGLHWLVWHPRYRRWIHYEPMTPKRLPAAAWHKLLYHGRVKRGD